MTDVHKMYICHSIFSRKTNQRNKVLVHVSYTYHAYLESRSKIKHSCWMEHGKTFCNIFVTDIHRENIPGFASNKSKEKTFDWFSHFKHVFVSFTSCLVQSILKKKFDCLLKLISKRTTRKTRFFLLARLSYSIFKKSVSSFLWN